MSLVLPVTKNPKEFSSGSGSSVRRIPASDHIEDAELVRRIVRGDRWAREVLYRRHVRYLTGVATRLLRSNQDADDVVQDTFITAFEKLGQLKDPEAVGMWLMQIAVRQVHARFRRRAVRRAFGLRGNVHEVALDTMAHPATPPDARAELVLVDRTVRTMPAKERIAWMLRRVDERPLAEVAELCDCSLATAKRRISAADARLEAHLGSDRRGDAAP